MEKNKKILPILDIQNLDASLNELNKKSQDIQKLLTGLSLSYVNNIVGSLIDEQNKIFLLLRNNIIYRINSIIFHLNLLLEVQESHINKLRKEPFNSFNRQILLTVGQEQQMSLFDSIIFHLSSLFDYFGNLVGFICSETNKLNLKWNSICKSCSDKKNNLSKSPVSEIIINLHRNFVDHFFNYRSELIHNKMFWGKAETSIDIMKAGSDSTIFVFAPNKFISKFKHLKESSYNHKLTLRYVSFWIIDESLTSTISIIEALFKHIDDNKNAKINNKLFFVIDDGKIKSI
jgi:hypothetical protein